MALASEWLELWRSFLGVRPESRLAGRLHWLERRGSWFDRRELFLERWGARQAEPRSVPRRSGDRHLGPRVRVRRLVRLHPVR